MTVFEKSEMKKPHASFTLIRGVFKERVVETGS